MIIDEHETSKAEEIEEQQGDGYNPTDQEKKALRTVDKLFSKSKRWRSSYDKKWMSNYKMFRGQQWPEQRPSYRHSEVINLIFQSIQSVVPIMTDARPRWEYMPQDPSDREFAEIMNHIAADDWTRNNWLMDLTEAVYDSHFYGTALLEMGYDPKAKPMQNDIHLSSCDTFSFYPDPAARDVNKKCRYVIKAEPQDIDQIKRDYPELGKFVRPDIVDAIKSEKTELEPIFQLRLPIDSTQSLRESGGNLEGMLDNKALKKTCYMLSDETEDVQTGTDPMTGEPIMAKRLKYPQGRKIVTAGGVVLEDGPMPYDDGQFPYARLINYALPREFWGISEVEQLESPQKIFNKLVSFALDVLTLMGNPIWIVDNESGVDTENIVSSPGLIIEKNKGAEVRREEGVQLQPFVFQLVDRMQEWFSSISGANESTPPPGVTAAAAIQDLQEASQTRIRLKTRYLDAALQNLGQMYLSRVLQYRDVPTVVRLTNNQNATQYFKFHVKPQVDENGQPMTDERGNPMKAAVIQVMGENGGYVAQKEVPIKGSLDVKVSTGTALPFMKSQKRREALELFDRQAIDQEELLKTVEWPNYQGVLERMQQAAAAAAQAQMQAKGAMQPPA